MTEDELPKCKLAEPGYYVHTPMHAVIHPHYGFMRSDHASEEE